MCGVKGQGEQAGVFPPSPFASTNISLLCLLSIHFHTWNLQKIDKYFLGAKLYYLLPYQVHKS